MVSKEYSIAVAEVLDILKYTDEELVKKIPEKLMKFWENDKSKTYIPKLDHNKKLTEMQLTPKTKSLLAMIYLKYFN